MLQSLQLYFYFNVVYLKKQNQLYSVKVVFQLPKILYSVMILSRVIYLFIFKDEWVDAMLTCCIVYTDGYCLTQICLCVTFTADDIRLLLVRGCLPVRLHSAAPQGAAGPSPPPHFAMLWLQVRVYAHTRRQTHT